MRWIWVCMGGGTTPQRANTSASMAAAAASLSFTASAARRSVHVPPSRCHGPGGVPSHAEGDWLHLDKHARPPGLPRVDEWTRSPSLIARTLYTTRTASRGGSAPSLLRSGARPRTRHRGPSLRCSSVRPRITAGVYSRWARGSARLASGGDGGGSVA
jgi:hypothetical protein